MASYPTSVWDGDSGSRDSDNAPVKAPDAQDYARMVEEVAAMQNQLGVGSDADAVAAVGVVGTSVVETSMRTSIQQMVLTIASLAITCAEGGTREYGSSLIHTFPQGAIKILGVTADLVITSSDYAAVEEGDFALGKIAATDRALTGDDVTMLAETALTFAAGEADLEGQGDIVAIQDGTSTPLPVYLNVCMDNGSGTGDIVVNGTVTITWCNLGDY